jgi:E3 ubiquitin-protein ligase FANCL
MCRLNTISAGYQMTTYSYSRSADITPRANFERALGISFPMKERAMADEQTVALECAVCYTYVLESTSGPGSSTTIIIPDEVCKNPKCNRVYHHCCLLDWLQSIPTTKSSFGTLFGSCPYCQDAISIRRHA